MRRPFGKPIENHPENRKTDIATDALGPPASSRGEAGSLTRRQFGTAAYRTADRRFIQSQAACSPQLRSSHRRAGSLSGRQWLILLSVQFTTILFYLTATSATVILPQLKGGSPATQEQISWVLARQIRQAADFAMNTAGRLAGVTPPTTPAVDDTSFAAAKTRVEITLGFVKSLIGAQIDGAESKVGDGGCQVNSAIAAATPAEALEQYGA